MRRWDGEVEEYKYPERSHCSLELDPPDRWQAPEHRDWDHDREDRRDDAFEHRERGFRILRAYYGAGGQFVNVTDRVRSHTDDGHLLLHIDNHSMGIDPLPGVHKWLRLLYVWNGERRSVMADEKTDLRLP